MDLQNNKNETLLKYYDFIIIFVMCFTLVNNELKHGKAHGDTNFRYY